MRLSAYSVVIAVVAVQLCGCMAAGGNRPTRNTDSRQVSRPVRPIDPWSLGPDVFAQTQLQQSSQDTAINEHASTSIEVLPTLDTAAVPAAVSVQAVQSHEEQLVPLELDEPQFSVQLGTFLDRARAQEFFDRAAPALGVEGEIQSDWPFFRLRFGKFTTRESADSLHHIAMKRGFYDARVVKLQSRP